MPDTPIRFGIHIGTQFAPWGEVMAVFRRAEALGYDTAWTYDHFTAVMMDPSTPCLEAWTCLGALATQTSRIRLGTLATGNTYRHPAILAKIATTVDVISGGRLEFCVGAGWYEPEHTMYGLPFGTAAWRADLLDEALSVIRLLWQEPTADFGGTHYSLQAAVAEPKPVQRPHPPITVAGGGEKTILPIVARHADAWSSFGSPTVFRRKIEVLRGLCDAAGRDCDAIEKSVLLPAFMTDDVDSLTPLVEGYADFEKIDVAEARNRMLLGSAGDVCRQVDAFLDAGVRHLVLLLTSFNLDVYEHFAAEVLPRYR